jgi:hypothetical protein
MNEHLRLGLGTYMYLLHVSIMDCYQTFNADDRTVIQTNQGPTKEHPFGSLYTSLRGPVKIQK